MFLFMYCNNHCPINLKEQRLFEVIVPTSDYYQSNQKVGIKWKNEKNSPRKFHCFRWKSKQEN